MEQSVHSYPCSTDKRTNVVNMSQTYTQLSVIAKGRKQVTSNKHTDHAYQQRTCVIKTSPHVLGPPCSTFTSSRSGYQSCLARQNRNFRSQSVPVHSGQASVQQQSSGSWRPLGSWQGQWVRPALCPSLAPGAWLLPVWAGPYWLLGHLVLWQPWPPAQVRRPAVRACNHEGQWGLPEKG